jgi:hypothetical protein
LEYRFLSTRFKLQNKQVLVNLIKAGYDKRKYRGKVEPVGWFLLTNITNLAAAIKAFKYRSGIEAMFKDCQTGGYNERIDSRRWSTFNGVDFTHYY